MALRHPPPSWRCPQRVARRCSVFDELQQRDPGTFADGQFRTLQHHIQVWRTRTVLTFGDEGWLDDTSVESAASLPPPLRISLENATRWATALRDAGADIFMTERVGSHGGLKEYGEPMGAAVSRLRVFGPPCHSPVRLGALEQVVRQACFDVGS